MVNAQLARCIVVAASIFGFSAPASQANNCKYGVCFGAVAATERGVAARASRFATAQAVWDRVDRICNGTCSDIQVFHSGCGAIVQGGRTNMFNGFGADKESALAEANASCLENGHRTCAVRVWACSK